MTGAVLLVTRRMTLRQFTWDDEDLLVELDADPEVIHFVTGGLSTPREEIRDSVLPAWLADYALGGSVWAAELRGSGEFVGWFHLRKDAGDGRDTYELGYRLRRATWGLGLATEGSLALIDHAFTVRRAARVRAETMAVHTASRRVMEKSGMRLVRTFPTEWPYPIPGDEHGDVEYAIDRADWERTRKADASSLVAEGARRVAATGDDASRSAGLDLGDGASAG